MTRFAIVRCLQGIIVIFGISLVVFFLIRLTGDPLNHLLPPDATQTEVDELTEYLGLDQPITVQYVRWFRSAIRGDFGTAFFRGGQPALLVVVDRLPASLLLGGIALGVATIIGIPSGVVAAMKPHSKLDNLISGLIVSLQAMPSFWFGIMLIIIFAVQLGWFPVSSFGTVEGAVLPVITLSTLMVPVIMKTTRARMTEILHEDYIRTARVKGLREAKVIFFHGLKNASVTIVTVIGARFAYIIAGSVAVETVFNWPGIGTLLISSVNNADYPVIQATVVVVAIGTVLVNLATDLLVAVIDPRVRRGLLV